MSVELFFNKEIFNENLKIKIRMKHKINVKIFNSFPFNKSNRIVIIRQVCGIEEKPILREIINDLSGIFEGINEKSFEIEILN